MLSIVDRHLEGASGLLAVVKAVMMIERKCLLPNALFEKMNPKIEGREKLRVSLQRLHIVEESAPVKTSVRGTLKSNHACLLAAGPAKGDPMAIWCKETHLCNQFR